MLVAIGIRQCLCGSWSPQSPAAAVSLVTVWFWLPNLMRLSVEAGRGSSGTLLVLDSCGICLWPVVVCWPDCLVCLVLPGCLLLDFYHALVSDLGVISVVRCLFGGVLGGPPTHFVAGLGHLYI